MEIGILREAVRSPTLMDVRKAREVLEDGFRKVARRASQTDAPIAIERRKEGASATLLALFVQSKNTWLIRPLIRI